MRSTLSRDSPLPHPSADDASFASAIHQAQTSGLPRLPPMPPQASTSHKRSAGGSRSRRRRSSSTSRSHNHYPSRSRRHRYDSDSDRDRYDDSEASHDDQDHDHHDDHDHDDDDDDVYSNHSHSGPSTDEETRRPRKRTRVAPMPRGRSSSRRRSFGGGGGSARSSSRSRSRRRDWDQISIESEDIAHLSDDAPTVVSIQGPSGIRFERVYDETFPDNVEELKTIARRKFRLNDAEPVEISYRNPSGAECGLDDVDDLRAFGVNAQRSSYMLLTVKAAVPLAFALPSFSQHTPNHLANGGSLPIGGAAATAATSAASTPSRTVASAGPARPGLGSSARAVRHASNAASGLQSTPVVAQVSTPAQLPRSALKKRPFRASIAASEETSAADQAVLSPLVQVAVQNADPGVPDVADEAADATPAAAEEPTARSGEQQAQTQAQEEATAQAHDATAAAPSKPAEDTVDQPQVHRDAGASKEAAPAASQTSVATAAANSQDAAPKQHGSGSVAAAEEDAEAIAEEPAAGPQKAPRKGRRRRDAADGAAGKAAPSSSSFELEYDFSMLPSVRARLGEAGRPADPTGNEQRQLEAAQATRGVDAADASSASTHRADGSAKATEASNANGDAAATDVPAPAGTETETVAASHHEAVDSSTPAAATQDASAPAPDFQAATKKKATKARATKKADAASAFQSADAAGQKDGGSAPLTEVTLEEPTQSASKAPAATPPPALGQHALRDDNDHGDAAPVATPSQSGPSAAASETSLPAAKKTRAPRKVTNSQASQAGDGSQALLTPETQKSKVASAPSDTATPAAKTPIRRTVASKKVAGPPAMVAITADNADDDRSLPPTASVVESQSLTPAPKRRGRPPRAEMEARLAEEAAAAGKPVDEAAPPAKFGAKQKGRVKEQESQQATGSSVPVVEISSAPEPDSQQPKKRARTTKKRIEPETQSEAPALVDEPAVDANTVEGPAGAKRTRRNAATRAETARREAMASEAEFFLARDNSGRPPSGDEGAGPSRARVRKTVDGRSAEDNTSFELEANSAVAANATPASPPRSIRTAAATAKPTRTPRKTSAQMVEVPDVCVFCQQSPDHAERECDLFQNGDIDALSARMNLLRYIPNPKRSPRERQAITRLTNRVAEMLTSEREPPAGMPMSSTSESVRDLVSLLRAEKPNGSTATSDGQKGGVRPRQAMATASSSQQASSSDEVSRSIHATTEPTGDEGEQQKRKAEQQRQREAVEQREADEQRGREEQRQAAEEERRARIEEEKEMESRAQQKEMKREQEQRKADELKEKLRQKKVAKAPAGNEEKEKESAERAKAARVKAEQRRAVVAVAAEARAKAAAAAKSNGAPAAPQNASRLATAPSAPAASKEAKAAVLEAQAQQTEAPSQPKAAPTTSSQARSSSCQVDELRSTSPLTELPSEVEARDPRRPSTAASQLSTQLRADTPTSEAELATSPMLQAVSRPGEPGSESLESVYLSPVLGQPTTTQDVEMPDVDAELPPPNQQQPQATPSALPRSPLKAAVSRRRSTSVTSSDTSEDSEEEEEKEEEKEEEDDETDDENEPLEQRKDEHTPSQRASRRASSSVDISTFSSSNDNGKEDKGSRHSNGVDRRKAYKVNGRKRSTSSSSRSSIDTSTSDSESFDSRSSSSDSDSDAHEKPEAKGASSFKKKPTSISSGSSKTPTKAATPVQRLRNTVSSLNPYSANKLSSVGRSSFANRPGTVGGSKTPFTKLSDLRPADLRRYLSQPSSPLAGPPGTQGGNGLFRGRVMSSTPDSETNNARSGNGNGAASGKPMSKLQQGKNGRGGGAGKDKSGDELESTDSSSSSGSSDDSSSSDDSDSSSDDAARKGNKGKGASGNSFVPASKRAGAAVEKPKKDKNVFTCFTR